MARPKEFDRDIALQSAIALFREQGYAGTSTGELMRAMDIGRQSMYDTFGDKHGLYLAALERYNGDSIADFARTMAAGPSPLGGLETALLVFAERASATRAGCMGVGALFEIGQADAEVALLNDLSGVAQVSAIERQLGLAEGAGEIAPGIDKQAAARFVAATLAGIKVAARSGTDLPALAGIIRFTINALRTASA